MIDITSLPIVRVDGRDWLRTTDAAKALGRSRQWVHVLISKRRLETTALNKSITLVSVESVMRLRERM